jgi:HD-like signal output (HDOD) protein
MHDANSAPTYQSGKKSVAPSGAKIGDGTRARAFQFLSGLAGELSGGAVDLPCFPDVVIRIRRALDDPKLRMEQTVTIVGSEPRLAAKLLQTANSAAFNTSGKPLTDLRTAITRLGHKMVQSAAMAYAVQQMKEEESLRSVAERLSELWKESIAVASIAQVVARSTKVTPDEAFLTGLLHGIGRLYILVRSAAKSASLDHDASFLEAIAGWQASIGKSVLENWGFAQEMADAVGDQAEYARNHKQADLTDVLVASILLSEALQRPAPRVVDLSCSTVFKTIGLGQDDCAAILTHTEYQLGSLHEALGC